LIKERPPRYAPLDDALSGHEVATAYEMGWSDLRNGDLLREAERSFDLFITTDQNLRYQQNLTDRRLAILVLCTTSWPVIRQRIPEVIERIAQMKAGDYAEVELPTR